MSNLANLLFVAETLLLLALTVIARLTIPFILVIGFQLIYETVVATLALTHIIPPSALGCELANNWQKLYQGKDKKAIIAIQDSFNCCGLNTVADRAFPFGNPSTCAADYGRSKSCFGEWRKAEQVDAGLLLLVAVVVFIVKVLSIIFLLASTPWTQSYWARPSKRISNGNSVEDEDDNRARLRRLAEARREEGRYRDNPAEGTITTENNGTENDISRDLPPQRGEAQSEWSDRDSSFDSSDEQGRTLLSRS